MSLDEKALEAAGAAEPTTKGVVSVAEAFRACFNPHDLPEGAFQLWESLGNEIERAKAAVPVGVREALEFAQSELAEAADKFWVIHLNHPGDPPNKQMLTRRQDEDKAFLAKMSERMDASRKRITDALSALPQPPNSSEGEPT